jgi:prepilin-type N-terminal cleavage/methylation domain-containing protein
MRRPVRQSSACGDRGFTLVEILIAIVLVGVLSAVAVVGVGSLTSKGSSASCSASADAARTAFTGHQVMVGSPAASFTDLTASGALSMPSGVSSALGGMALAGNGWTLLWYAATSGPPQLVCTTSDLTGASVGLNSSVYNATDFTGLVQTSTLSTSASASWGYGVPYPGMGDAFSARYTGSISIPVSGTWSFGATADNYLSVWINNQQLFNSVGTASTQVNLPAGVYPVRIDFVEVAAAANWSLTWTPPGGSAVTIPASAFSTATTVPVLSGTTAGPTLALASSNATTASFTITPNVSVPKVAGSATTVLTCTSPGQTTRTSTTGGWSAAVDGLTTGATYSCTATLDDSPASAAVVVTPGAASGVPGLTALMYQSSAFTNGVTSYVHSGSAAASWGYGFPYPGMVDAFSTRYTGSITIPSTGSWSFTATADNRLSVWINNQQLFNTVSAGTTAVTLTAGTYPIRIDFVETGAAANWSLTWTPPGGAAATIPASAFTTV